MGVSCSRHHDPGQVVSLGLDPRGLHLPDAPSEHSPRVKSQGVGAKTSPTVPSVLKRSDSKLNWEIDSLINLIP